MNTSTLSQKNPHQWFIIAAVMLATVMEILDTTIVNVSLPHMMGSLGADRDQISWVLTSYIVAAGILMPLTGFLIGRLGSRRLLLINIVGFMLASALCGAASNLAGIVFFRLLQGVFGASLVPLSQFILRETFSREDQPKAMAIWGIGIMAAPVMGPTLGGYITDNLNWRWIFYINVPICIISFILALGFIKESTIKKEPIDWLGMTLLIVSIGALQLFLDRGEVDDWFNSASINWLLGIFILSFTAFLIHSFRVVHPIINLRLFKDRNFAYGTLLMTFFAASVLGSLTLLPAMLEILFGYSSDLAGLVMAPRGIASGIMMGIAAQLIKRIDARWIILTGLLIATYSTQRLSAITLDTSMIFMLTIGFIQGIGIGCFFMPLSTIVYTTLPNHAIAEATGLFSFGRNIGNAIGISLFTTFLDRDTQIHWHILGGHLRPTNAVFMHWLQVQHLSIWDSQTIGRLGALLNRQASFIAYIHAFRLSAFILLASMLTIFLIKMPKNKRIFLPTKTAMMPNEVD